MGRPGRGHRLGDQDRPAAAPTPAPPRAGPLFLTDIAPAPAATGRARLSYRRAAEIFTTASGGWTLRQLRHSRLTHLAKAGVGLPLLMTKSRHTSLLASLAIYAKPTFDAVAAATAALDPDRRR